MLEGLFTGLSSALAAGPLLALGSSFAWGVASVVLSPCHLAGVPLIVGFVSGRGRSTARGQAFLLSLFFASGILVTIALVGIVTGFLGRLLGDTGPATKYIVAGLLLLVGLHLLGLLPLPFFDGAGRNAGTRRGRTAAFLLGLGFGAALGPCTFAYMMPVLGLAFALGAQHFPLAAGLVLAYAAGHCAVIVAAGSSAAAVQRFLRWEERSRGTVITKKICGVLVILGGLYLALQ
jgi:cytochrome c-type biogenesis protein